MSQSPTRLTESFVKGLQPEDKLYEVRDTIIKGFVVRVRPTGNKTFLLYYRHDGKKRTFTIGKHGTLKTQAAREIAEQRVAEVRLGKDIQQERLESRRQAQVNEIATVGAFFEHRHKPWLLSERPRSAKGAIDIIQFHFSHLFSRMLSDLTLDDIYKWREAQINLGRKASTINRNFTALRTLVSNAVEWGVVERHPFERLKPLKEDISPIIRYLDQEEEISLRNALAQRDYQMTQKRESANSWRRSRSYPELRVITDDMYADHLHPLVLLVLNTGLRRGEAFNLKWEDINFREKVLTVKAEGTKSGKARYIPLNREALTALRRWKIQNIEREYVFFDPSAKTKLTTIKTSWKNLCKRASLTGFRFHDLRHHFASKLVMKGIDLNTVRELLGHSKYEVTLKYAHLAPNHKHEAVRALELK